MDADAGVVREGLLRSIAAHERDHGQGPTLHELSEAAGIPPDFMDHLERRLRRELGAGRVAYLGGRWRLTTAGHARTPAPDTSCA